VRSERVTPLKWGADAHPTGSRTAEPSAVTVTATEQPSHAPASALKSFRTLANEREPQRPTSARASNSGSGTADAVTTAADPLSPISPITPMSDAMHSAELSTEDSAATAPEVERVADRTLIAYLHDTYATAQVSAMGRCDGPRSGHKQRRSRDRSTRNGKKI
jgi:hypothetical protein